jgi:transcriptional regulator with XRE-family HTH domain
VDLGDRDIQRGIGRAVELLRVRAGLSRDALAAKADPPLSRSTVLKIEKGERVPTADTLRRVAQALDIAIDELLVAAWICAEEDAVERLKRAHMGAAAGLFAEPSNAVKVGALAGLGLIAILGAPVVVGAAAATAAGSLVWDREARIKTDRDVADLQAKLQERVARIKNAQILQDILDGLPLSEE